MPVGVISHLHNLGFDDARALAVAAEFIAKDSDAGQDRADDSLGRVQ